MKFAVLGDIHSNIYSLQSVLNDIENRQVDFILSTGDLVGYLPYPNEVIELIRKNKILSIQGNHDKYIANCEHFEEVNLKKIEESKLKANASEIYTNMVLKDDNRSYLKNMPQNILISVDKIKLLLVHGSHRRIDEYLYEKSEELQNISKEIDSDIIICGHTHIPYHTNINGKHFINSGSVGKPKHGNSNATYIIVDIKNNDVYVEIIEVPYDMEKMVEDIKNNKFFDDKIIDMLRNGY